MMKNAKMVMVPTMMLAVGMLLVGCSGDASKKSPSQEDSKVVDAGPGITLANLEKVVVGDTKTGEGGSTHEEVIALFGKEAPGKASMKFGGKTTDQFQWYEGGMADNEDIIYVEFTDGHVSAKSSKGFGE